MLATLQLRRPKISVHYYLLLFDDIRLAARSRRW